MNTRDFAGFASMFNVGGRRGYAAVGGYFWKPCPMCGVMFSGADMDRGGTIWYDGEATWRKGMGTCPSCPGDWISPAAPRAMYRTNLDRPIPCGVCGGGECAMPDDCRRAA